MHYLVKSFLIWLLFIPLAIANGALRDLVITPALGDTLGRAVSSLTLSILILALTLLFEVSFFVLVMGHPIDELLKDFDLFRGRLWLIVLVTTFFAPLLASKTRK